MLSDVDGYKTKPEWFIGKGSFGSVYKVEKSGKFYAMKVFQSELLKTEYKVRIDYEIKALQKISHPNVVKLHDFGTFKENEFDYFYTVMDFVDGQPLTDFVGTVDELRCIEIIESVFDTLAAVHADGVIHRDLKPANIMVDKNGTPIILDFGLAKLIDYSSITQTGDRIGTYCYMSPEQVTDSKNIDERSDYFAVGVIFYELLAGVTPYDATNLPALIDQIKNQYPKNPSERNPSISNQTENVILRLLEKAPHRRYQKTNEVVNALKATPEVRPKKLDLSTRYFIRLLHTEKALFEDAFIVGLVEHVIFPANFFKFYHHTVAVLRKSGISFCTDPATNRLTYAAFSKTKGVQELPYSSGDEVTPIQKKDFHSILQVQEYVKKVLCYQVTNGVTELAAPFFFAKDSSDDWFNINLKLLKESIAYRDQHLEEMPIWAGICMNVENWYDDDEKNKILNYYVKAAPDGFFVYGDSVSNQSNLTQLFHYSDLLRKLQASAGTPVVACRVSSLGLILLSIGVSGFSSGVASLDNFRENILSDTKEGYSADSRYYIPQLLSMVSLPERVTARLLDIGRSSVAAELRCACPYCTTLPSGPITQKNMKLHFLHARKQEIAELDSLNPGDRLDLMEEKVKQAIAYSKTLLNEGVKVGDFSHLSTWHKLIQEIKKHS